MSNIFEPEEFPIGPYDDDEAMCDDDYEPWMDQERCPYCGSWDYVRN